MQEEPPIPPPLERARRAFGWILTVAVAFAWAGVVVENAWHACWPHMAVAKRVELLGMIGVPILIIGGGVLAMWKRDGKGDLLGYALLLGVVWLPHADLMVSFRTNAYNHPANVLKEITMAQSLFRESDKEGDSVLDYGTLTELVEQNLVVDSRGKRMLQGEAVGGYRYRVQVSPTTSEFLWAAVANPVQLDPLSPEPRLAIGYLTNHKGTFAGLAPLEVDPKTCAAPQGVFPYPEQDDQVYGLLKDRPIAKNRFWAARAPFGFGGTLAMFWLLVPSLGAWVLQLGPFRPTPETTESTPGEDDVAGEPA